MSPIIVIVGRPNVGKSTLFNRLSRSREALTDDCPGITRDRLYAPITYDAVPLTLVDTGGFDVLCEDVLLEKVRDQVEMAIDEADRIIFMVDGKSGLVPADIDLSNLLRRSKKKIFVAVNKVDGPEHDHLIHDFYRLGEESFYPISAAHGYGIRSLMCEVIKKLPQSEPEINDNGEVRVAILGRPNAGKSSLINRILGSERLLVSEMPGTTRDAVDTVFSYRDRKYVLIDTAGIRRKTKVKEKIERFSMIKAIRTLERCHVATIILDATQGVSQQDARISGYAFEKGRAAILAVNKWDLIKNDRRKKDSLDSEIERQLKFISFAPRINLSALTGERVMKLFDRLDQVYDQFCFRISTSSLNSALQKMLKKNPPPRIGTGRFKLFYATQTRTKPPTFALFVNRPNMIHFSYERFLINQLRLNFGLDFTPIRLKFKKK